MKQFILAGVVASALLTASSAAAVTFSAYDEFNISGGGITATNFAYGWTPVGEFSGTINAFNNFQTACGGDPNVECALVDGLLPGVFKAAGDYAAPGTAFLEANELNLHPGAGNEIAVVQFIVPTTGTYVFSGGWHAHDISPNSVDVSAYIGGAQQFSSVMSGGSRAIDFNADLSAGDRVSFLLGSAGSYFHDSTGFALTVETQAVGAPVPEPATWALMIMGFGSAGAMIRRRRLAVG